MSKVQYNRAPCPGRVFEDLGNGFAIGCAGGTLFYFGKGKSSCFKSILFYIRLFLHLPYFLLGLINAPKGQRLFSGLCHIRNRAPFLGGNFGLWGGMFSSMDCLLISYR